MVPPSSDKISRVPSYLICIIKPFAYRTITYYGQTFQSVLLDFIISAEPLSLAATQGISIDFFSSGYLDVSVLRVCFLHLCIQCKILYIIEWVAPFGNLGLNVLYQLVQAYRRLTRPSSPLTAKASTVYAYSLNHTTQGVLGLHVF